MPRQLDLDPEVLEALRSHLSTELQNHRAERGKLEDRWIAEQNDFWAEPSQDSQTPGGFASIIVPLTAIACEAIHSRVMGQMYGLKELVNTEVTADASNIRSSLDMMFNHELMNEMRLTKVLFDVERRGMQLDMPYVKEALEHENANAERAKQKFFDLTNRELIDSNKNMESIFKEWGIDGGKTEKGNASFTEKTLSKIDSEIARTLLEYRDSIKRASTYFSSFSYWADDAGVVHGNFRQGGTQSGRFSISDPATIEAVIKMSVVLQSCHDKCVKN